MTDNTQPEALRLADELEVGIPFAPSIVQNERALRERSAAELRRQHARIVELEAQLEAIGAGGVGGPLIGQPQAPLGGRWYMVNRDGMATLCTDRADAEKEAEDAQSVWPHMGPHRAVQLVEASFDAADMATAAAQGFRDGVASVSASAGGEPVAYATFADNGNIRLWSKALVPHPDAKPLYLHPSPPEGMVGGWISVEDRLPEPNVEVLCAGQGWGNPFVTACYYDDERREWYPVNTHWTDSAGGAQYPTHWMPLPPPPTTSAGSGKGE